ncbi:MAG: outer membrane lipoprotein carrier protein LolA [Alphaproteobacteria bacterium]|jgi:outer membrane lipoprotein-sorting protein|nr:outer membrane lipoprotein carrier protein LolA [Alphaproteobacteria bacterium]
MKINHRRLSLIIMVLIIILFTLRAVYGEETAQEEFTLSAEQKAEIAGIDKKYNQFISVRSRFIQRDSLGNVAHGWFVLEKPNKLRVEYDNIPIRFIAGGSNLLYQDIKLKQKSFIPIKSTPFYYLLDNKASFLNEDIKIVGFESTDDFIKITLVSAKAPAMGSLSLFLSKDSAQILKWDVLDAKGIRTEIYLSNPEFSNTKIANSAIFNTQRIKEVDFAEAK